MPRHQCLMSAVISTLSPCIHIVKEVPPASTTIYSPMDWDLGWRRVSHLLWWNPGHTFATIFAFFSLCEWTQNSAESTTHLCLWILFPSKAVRHHLTWLDIPRHSFLHQCRKWIWVALEYKTPHQTITNREWWPLWSLNP